MLSQITGNSTVWHLVETINTANTKPPHDCPFVVVINQSHNSHNAPVSCATIHHSEQKCAHFFSEWCIAGYGTSVLWDLWDWSIHRRPVDSPHKGSVWFPCHDVTAHGLVQNCGISMALHYYNDLKLSRKFQPMAAQLSMKAAPPLAKILVTASCCRGNTGHCA